MRKRIIVVDVNTLSSSIKTIRCRQYDIDEIFFLLKNNGKDADLTGYVASAFFQLPNKTVVQKNGIIEDNIIKVELDNYISSQSGKIILELTLTNGDKVLTLFRMFLDVEKSIDKNEAIQSQEQWDAIKDILYYADNMPSIDDINDAISNSHYYGTTAPSNDDGIWFYKNSYDSEEINYGNPIITELFAQLQLLRERIEELEEEVEYLKLTNGEGGNDDGDDEEDIGNYLLLEDGRFLLLEDGNSILLEGDYENISNEPKILLENGGELLLEDGSKILLENLI